MRTMLAAACASLTCLGVSGCSMWYQNASAQRSVTQSAAHVSGSGLTIRTHNGAVEVIGSPQRGDIEIEATLTARAATEPEAQQRVAAAILKVERDEQGRLLITPVFPEPKASGDGASITVRLPGADEVTVSTSNGPVTVRGLAGQLVVNTSNGAVQVADHDGPAHIDTSNGPVNVSNHAGALVVDTSNGSVHLDNVSGPVTAVTSNGPITLALRPDQRGPLHLDTSNGPITVRVGPGFTGAVRLGTSNARVTVNDPLKRITDQSVGKTGGSIEVGQGSDTSQIDTSNAPIEFTISG